MTTVTAGMAAPEFRLANQDGKDISLAALRGSRIVLYFYPKALTPGCTTQACGLRDSNEQLAALNAVVLGISTDPVSQLRKFSVKHQLNFDLLSDLDHQVADAYGVWGLKKFMGKEYMGVARRTFVIDEGGLVVTVMDSFKTSSHHQDLLSELQALER